MSGATKLLRLNSKKYGNSNITIKSKDQNSVVNPDPELLAGFGKDHFESGSLQLRNMNDKLIKIHIFLTKCSIKEFIIKNNSPKKLEVIKKNFCKSLYLVVMSGTKC